MKVNRPAIEAGTKEKLLFPSGFEGQERDFKGFFRQ